MANKNILILSNNVISDKFNNGVTIKNIFQNWPDCNLAQIYFNNERLEVNNSITFWKLDFKNLLKNFFGKFNKESFNLNNIMKSNSSVNIKSSFFVRYCLRDFLYFFLFRFSEPMKKELANFKPEAIFLVAGGSFFSFYIAFVLSKKLNIPVSVFITDNYLYKSNANSVTKNFFGCYTSMIYSRFLPRAKNLFVISDELGKNLKKKYSVDYHLLINPGRAEAVNTTKAGSNDVKKLAYFGGLHFERDEVLCSFAKKIKSKCADLEVKVFTFNPTQLILDCEFIETCPPVTGNEYLNAVLQVDALIHVESFNPDIFEDIKYSISTKIPEYMYLKKPIVAVGPSCASSIKFIKNNGLGLVLDDPSFESDEFIFRIRELLFSDSNESFGYEAIAYEYWLEHFSPNAVYIRLQKLL